jgi:hypothetical protein
MLLPEIITDLIISYLDFKSVLVLSRANRFWFSRTCQGLKVLDMTEHCIYSDITDVLKRFNKLKTLVTQNTFDGVKLECLRVLIMTGVPEGMRDFCVFLADCKALQELCITESIGYQNDHVLFTLADNASFLTILETDQAYDITNEGLDKLLTNCKSLKELTIMNCPNITRDAFMNAKNLNLQKINLTKCRLVCDDLVKVISQTCHKLVDFDISNDSLISDISPLSSLHYLLSLKLSGCYLLNDQSFGKFSSSSLNDLDISFCNGITDDGLSYILCNCQNINTINLQEASGVSLKGIDGACKSKNGLFYGSILELK